MNADLILFFWIKKSKPLNTAYSVTLLRTRSTIISIQVHRFMEPQKIVLTNRSQQTTAVHNNIITLLSWLSYLLSRETLACFIPATIRFCTKSYMHSVSWKSYVEMISKSDENLGRFYFGRPLLRNQFRFSSGSIYLQLNRMRLSSWFHARNGMQKLLRKWQETATRHLWSLFRTSKTLTY